MIKEKLDKLVKEQARFIRNNDLSYDEFNEVNRLSRDLKSYVRCVSNNVWLFESRISKTYTTAGFRKIVRKYRDLAGLSDKIYPHNFRHLVGTEAIKLGYSKEEVQNLLRHTSIKSTDIYTNTNQEWTRAIGAKLEQQFNNC